MWMLIFMQHPEETETFVLGPSLNKTREVLLLLLNSLNCGELFIKASAKTNLIKPSFVFAARRC